MPTAEELVSVKCIEELGGLLAAASPGRRWTATRAVPVLLPPLGLSDRVRAVRDALLADLPGDYPGTEEILLRALNDPNCTGWMIWPVTEAVASRALGSAHPGAFEAGLDLLAQLTSRLTGEFALRAFLNADLDRTLCTVSAWTSSPDENVRRLASEGTRPRLPWAKKVPALFAWPGATRPVLDSLHDDPSEYVRRSVANHLNDVSRIDPALAVEIAGSWTADDGGQTAPVVRHGLRTLVKQADPGALRRDPTRPRPLHAHRHVALLRMASASQALRTIRRRGRPFCGRRRSRASGVTGLLDIGCVYRPSRVSALR